MFYWVESIQLASPRLRNNDLIHLMLLYSDMESTNTTLIPLAIMTETRKITQYDCDKSTRDHSEGIGTDRIIL